MYSLVFKINKLDLSVDFGFVKTSAICSSEGTKTIPTRPLSISPFSFRHLINRCLFRIFDSGFFRKDIAGSLSHSIKIFVGIQLIPNEMLWANLKALLCAINSDSAVDSVNMDCLWEWEQIGILQSPSTPKMKTPS